MKLRLSRTRWVGKAWQLGLCCAALLVLAGCNIVISEGAEGRSAQVALAPPVTAYVKPGILEARQHDAACYTQGLLPYNGYFYESCGLYKQSSLRKVDPKTGAVLQEIKVPDAFFAEGIALVGNRLIQLTWQENVAFVYDVTTFEKVEQFSYEGEGWGLCYDGQVLYMSNGSDKLYLRDPKTFELKQTISVQLFDEAVFQLNELECVGNYVYANIFYSDTIVKIDKVTGRVAAYIDTRDLILDGQPMMTPQQVSLLQQRNVLNGISYDPETGNFMLTGKLWPVLFVVRLDER
jgi:glutaminyl-peptide cyclotransferase